MKNRHIVVFCCVVRSIDVPRVVAEIDRKQQTKLRRASRWVTRMIERRQLQTTVVTEVD